MLPVYAHGTVSAQTETEVNVNAELPAGIRHAAGIQQRIEGGKGLPPGIVKKLEREDKEDKEDKKEERRKDRDDDEKDVTAPTLWMIMAVDRTKTSARVIWASDERASGKVWLSTNASVDTSGAATLSLAPRWFFHSFVLKNLKPGTTYYYVVASADASGNVAKSDVQSFVTDPVPAPLPDTRAPVVVQHGVNQMTQTSAKIHWVTNEKTTGKVLVSAVTPVLESQSKVYTASDLSAKHGVSVAELTPNTMYHYLIVATDASGNVGAAVSGSFKTEVTDTVAPIVRGPFVLQIGADRARVIWSTNERADAKVWVSATSPVAISGAATASVAARAFFHDLWVTGLSANTTYHFVVSSTDASGNASTQAEGTFTTEAK